MCAARFLEATLPYDGHKSCGNMCICAMAVPATVHCLNVAVGPRSERTRVIYYNIEDLFLLEMLSLKRRRLRRYKN